MPVILWVVKRAIKKRFGKALNSRQRRAQLVRYVGHEILANLFEPANLRYFVKHDHRAGRLRLLLRVSDPSDEARIVAAVTEKCLGCAEPKDSSPRASWPARALRINCRTSGCRIKDTADRFAWLRLSRFHSLAKASL